MSFRALTVGDGDLSFSLALKRAYPQISVTASTLVASLADLCQTYAHAVETSRELTEVWKERILYGVDATKLGGVIHVRKEEEKFDVILWNHPHLGDATLLQSEQRHAERHHALLSHYFFSAKSLLKSGGAIHVCLSGNQPKSWCVMAAAENAGLECVAEETTACPVDKWLFREGDIPELAEVQPHYPTKRKFRNGSLGSKHFLARYGYRHERNQGNLFEGSVKHLNVEQSMNFLFECSGDTEKPPNSTSDGGNMCSICKLRFESKEELSAHLDAPALPDAVTFKMTSKAEQSKRDLVGTEEKRNTATAAFDPIRLEDAVVILIETTVSAAFDSKRIKYVCRQDGFATSKHIRSKSQCEDAIKRGRVFVNGHAAFDTGRIVHEGDVITLVADDTQKQPERAGNADVRIVKEICNNGIALVAVYKPVGIRCVGSFSPNTLESITKKRVESNRGVKSLCCTAISKLDTGCAGLCMLAVSPTKIDERALCSIKVLYTFSVLVHGSPPGQWKIGVYVKIPTEGLRQWKRHNTDESDDGKVNRSDSIVASTTELGLNDSLFLKCIDSLELGEQSALSTLTVQSRFDDGRCANVISYVLRKLGYPVVGDRFCKREYTTLPQRLRNLVKHKVCIGCYSLVVEYGGFLTPVSIEQHKRTQCSFWRDTLSEQRESKAN